jgi:hypothetical protein
MVERRRMGRKARQCDAAAACRQAGTVLRVAWFPGSIDGRGKNVIRIILLASMATLVLAPGAQAQCSCATNQVTNSAAAQNLSLALAGNTVCVAKGGGRWQNQEWHQGGPAGGALIDFKKGPTDPIDPTKGVGTWSISGADEDTRVTYSYVPAGVGSYAVCSSKSQPGPGDTIGFCANTTSSSTIAATLQAGVGACH